MSLATDIDLSTFRRTTCDCSSCVGCCKSQPGPLAPRDFEKIATFIGRSPEPYLWASPGAVLMSADRATRRVGTITPRFAAGRCVFLDTDDRCTIHPVAPFGCAYFDTHMPPAESQPRGIALYQAIERDRTYQTIRGLLPMATHWRPRS